MRYNIKGERIYIAQCINCGNQEYVTLDEFNKFINILDLFESTAKCCEKPMYLWDTNGNFSVP